MLLKSSLYMLENINTSWGKFMLKANHTQSVLDQTRVMTYKEYLFHVHEFGYNIPCLLYFTSEYLVFSICSNQPLSSKLLKFFPMRNDRALASKFQESFLKVESISAYPSKPLMPLTGI